MLNAQATVMEPVPFIAKALHGTYKTGERKEISK